MSRRIAQALAALAFIAGCESVSTDMRKDVEEARSALQSVDIAQMTARMQPPASLTPVRDLQGDAAAEYLEALDEYRGHRRPNPERDVTAIEPGPGLDPAPFSRFADSQPVRLIMLGSRRALCRFTGTLIPIGENIVDGEVLSLDACVKMALALAARSLELEFSGNAADAEIALLCALSFGMHLEEDAALANCATGRAVQMQAAFHLEQFYRRMDDLEKAADARRYGAELMRRGRPWLLLPYLNVLCSDGDSVAEAVEVAIKSGSLPLACEVAGSVALGRLRNLSESRGSASVERFKALEVLKEAFKDPAMQKVADRAESMLLWPPEKAEKFAVTHMAGVKRY